MEVKRFFIHREYDIMCKMFLPGKAKTKHIIIGVHGFAGDKESSMLEKLANVCTVHGTTLICFDFPAHGESPVNENMFTVDNCKKDLMAVVEYVKEMYPCAQKSIFATSFGGYISLLCCDLFPEFKLVLRAPAITMPDLLLTNILRIDVDTFKTQGFVNCGFERTIKLPYIFYEELCCQENLLFKDFKTPMLIVHGDSDDIVPYAIINEFAKKHNNVELYVIKGADHRFKNAGEIDKIVGITQKFLEIY